MVNCSECGAELTATSKYCSNCGTQAGLEKDVYHVSADTLVGKVKEIVSDARVRRIVIKDDKGKVLLSIPVSWGAAGAIVTLTLAPWLAAIGVIAAIVTRCTIEVERTVEK